MRVIPEMLCVANQWPAVEFWQNVKTAVRMVEAEMTLVQPSVEEIEQMILRSWLDFAAPAGTA